MGNGRILAVGAAYFALAYAAGFALGALRTIVVRPYLGPDISRLAELPIMIVISFLAARLIIRHMGPGSRDDWMKVGGFAFLLLIITEITMGRLLFGISLRGFVADILTPVGMISLIAQGLLIIFPALAAGWDRTAQ